jgi:potassium channel subfamily K
MNDPGLDKPISDEAKDIENQIGRAKKEDEAEEQALLAPR